MYAIRSYYENRTCSSYPACSPDVNLNGGTWVDVGFEGAHVDGNLVSAAAWPAHPELLAKFNELFRITSYNVCYTKLLRFLLF